MDLCSGPEDEASRQKIRIVCWIML